MPASDMTSKLPTVIILLGPPGSGKGTVAEEYSKIKNLPHISTGDLFYDNLRDKTELGLQAKHYLDKGQLVPDSLVLDIIFDRISMPDCSKGYIMDGVPRNIAQVHELEDYLRDKAQIIAVKLAANDSIVTSRLTGRLMCNKCNHSFHKESLPPKQAGKCDFCGCDLVQRSDDTQEAIKERLKVYHEQSEPIEKYYKEKGLLKELDATKSADQVLSDLETLLT